MKKWFKFFFLSFFSHKIAKEGTRRGYTNSFFSFVLALVFIWMGFIGGDMLPFSAHYDNSHDFASTARAVFANPDRSKRFDAEIENGILKVKEYGGEFSQGLLINTFENHDDKQDYSMNGYNVVVDTRPANTLAEIEAVCVSNDETNTIISYQDYLTLSDVAKYNFDFKLIYTGNALELNDELVEEYKTYLNSLSDENKAAAEKLANDLTENTITKDEYNRAIYELYFENYYPEITEYESSSKVPLLRNYYYHEYIIKGTRNYLLIFDDYMAGSFKTKNGIDISFYGFYSNLEDGILISNEATQEVANASVDKFIKNSFKELLILNAYAYAMNTISVAPFIALMLMVATLLTYSILKLRAVESITSLGAMFRIVGSFVYFSGIIAAVFTVIIAFFVERNLINALPLVLFFVALVIRSVVFAIKETRLYRKQLEEQEYKQMEV